MKKNKLKRNYKALIAHMKEDKVPFAIFVILRLLVIVIMIAQFFNKNYENVFLCILTLILFTLPAFFEINFKVELPDAMEVVILLFIFSAEILGEIQEFYIIFPFWDDMLHTINGFLAAAIGFSMIDFFNRSKRLTFHLSPFFVAMFAFCFSMTIGVLWEFFEFFMDTVFRFDMQKDTILTSISTVMLDPAGRNKVVIINDIKDVAINGESLGLGGYLDIGLYDTMKDLIVNCIGAITFSIIGFFYIKRRGKGKLAKHFIPKVKMKDKAIDIGKEDIDKYSDIKNEDISDSSDINKEDISKSNDISKEDISKYSDMK